MVVAQVHSCLMNTRVFVNKGQVGKKLIYLLHEDTFLTHTNLKRFVILKSDK